MRPTHAVFAFTIGVLLPGCASTPRSVPAGDVDLAITQVAVIDVERGRVLPGRSVLIKSNRIAGVEPTERVRIADGVRTIDGTGKYLIPGLWDMHVHVSASDPSQVEMPLFIAHGVTGVRVMSTDRPSVVPEKTPGLDQHRQWQARVSSGTMVGPRLMALATWIVNGPGGITEAMPAFYKARTREEGQQLARYFKDRGFDFVKVYNNLPRDGFLGLAEEAKRLGLPFAGHEPSALSAIELSNAGQASVEHSRVFLFNCFPGADSMRKGLLKVSQTVRGRRMVDEYDPARCAEVFRTFARNRTYITPTHVTRRMDAFAGDTAYRRDARMRWIPLRQRVAWLDDADGMVASDPSAAGRKAFMDFYQKGLTLTLAAYRAGVPIMLGTDAGDSFVFPGGSVHDELGELVKAGLSPAEALRAATMSGAEFLGQSTEFGSVAAGRHADLVLLDANPLADIANAQRIRTVVMNGRAFDRAQLDSMLAHVEVAIRPDPQVQLWAAASLGDTSGIARALAAGARIDSLDTQLTGSGRRALNYAALRNRGPAVRFLLGRGATIDLANNTGFTPVHHAVEGGAREALSILIAAGADVSRATTQGVRPIDMARQRGDETMVTALEGAPRKQ